MILLLQSSCFYLELKRKNKKLSETKEKMHIKKQEYKTINRIPLEI